MAFIQSAKTNFVLDTCTIKDVLALKREISLLCVFYDITVTFQFESLKKVPENLTLDCQSLKLHRSILIKKKPLPQQTLEDAQVLFNFLSLVRFLAADLGSTQTELLITEFNRKSLVYLPAHAIRQTGIGQCLGENPFRPGTSNLRQVSSILTLKDSDIDTTSRPKPMTEVSNTRTAPSNSNSSSKPTSIVRFNPFKSNYKLKPKPSKSQPAVQTDLDTENCPALLSDAPLRMRRKNHFGLRRF